MQHIQWFPGHMTKAMRMMEESVRLVDGVLVVLDARAPAATINKKLNRLFGGKPVLYILNKADLADDKKTDASLSAFSKAGMAAPQMRGDPPGFGPRDRRSRGRASPRKIRQRRGEGDGARPQTDGLRRAEHGKSSVINALGGGKRAATGDKAGVTRGKQWIRCAGFELLDTPGTMPPSFDDQTLARHLAYIGSINDDILDMSELALEFLREISVTYPDFLRERYEIEDFSSPLAMYEQVCRRRGFMLRGGDFDYERGGKAIIDDFRKGRLGAISLECAADYADSLR